MQLKFAISNWLSRIHFSIPMKTFHTLAGILFILGTASAYGQAPSELPIKWAVAPTAHSPAPGEVFEVTVEASLEGAWHLYSATQPPGGPIPTKFSLASADLFQIAGYIKQTRPTTQFDPNFNIPTEFFSKSAKFWISIKSDPGINPGTYEVPLQVFYQLCNDQVCLPPRRVPIPFTIKLIQKAPASPEGSANSRISSNTPTEGQKPGLENAAGSKETASKDSKGAESGPTQNAGKQGRVPLSGPEVAGTAAEVQQARMRGFWPYLWLAMTMGALSLLTPCVFPMIPITVSYFTKNAESAKSSGIKLAFVYCAGIIFTFTGLGLGLAALLGATGINQFAANPWINLIITAIFIGFALNLFGLYQIGVPSSVLTTLSKIGGKGGYLQALLMGLTFTLTSFTCTVPFVGTVLVATSQGEWLWPALGMLGFSTVFAVPFFALALLPRLLTTLPKSGGWLNSVKVVMGFLEVAAAMKFISNVDLVWSWHIFDREVVLAVWIAIAVLATTYLLGKFRLPHDSPVESLGVVRLLAAMLFLAIGFYLFTGLMGGSLGELDAFLPPRTSGMLTLTGSGSPGLELTWQTNLDAALQEARREQKNIFIDFTGYTCTNCRWMESNVFPLAAVHAELLKFVRLQLYTDGIGKQYEENQKYQKANYGTVALPLYAIIDPQGIKIASFPGMTRKPEEFLRFLRTAPQPGA